MIKYTIILMNMLAILLMRVFFAGDVTVKMDAPSKVKQGEEYTISFTINKGSIAGVGHMKQELPAGLGNATVVEAKGGEFKYMPEDNVIKFTWISLPADQEFTVSYKVKVNADAPNGNVNLAGKFSYVLNNEKQTFMIPDATLMIGEDIVAATTTKPENTTTAAAPAETTATTTKQPETTTTAATQPETTAATTTTPTQPEVTTPPAQAENTTTQTQPTTTTTTPTNTSTTAEAKTAATITASRTIVGSPEAGAEFTVEVNVMKDGMKGFARIQETLPMGLTAMSLDNKGGTFSFIDQKVKIIWDNLPADENVKISYRVVVAENAAGEKAISGSFSYVENDDPKKAEIATTTISIKAKTAVVAADNTAQNTSNTTATTANNSTSNNTTSSNTQTTSNTNTQTTASNTNTIPEPENKVSYKVQICALSKMQRGTSYFESKFAIGDKVSMEMHEGWKKYMVGKYNQYKDARDYRETVRSKGVESPFVTAYNTGKRITVQEALMVSSQQWVR